MRRSRSRRRSDRPETLDADSELAREEALRILRTNVLVSIADLESPVVVVTSALPSEGKTSTCAELAVSLSRAGSRVILVDLDLRHPDAHNWVGGHNDVGAADVVEGRASLQDSLQCVDTSDHADGATSLYFLAAGTTDEPTEVLSSDRTRQLLESVAAQADVVLVDSAPVLPVADALVIGRWAAGAVLVVAARSTSQTAVTSATASLTRNRTRLLGIVLNKVAGNDLVSDSGYGLGYGDRDRTNGRPRRDNGRGTTARN